METDTLEIINSNAQGVSEISVSLDRVKASIDRLEAQKKEIESELQAIREGLAGLLASFPNGTGAVNPSLPKEKAACPKCGQVFSARGLHVHVAACKK